MTRRESCGPRKSSCNGVKNTSAVGVNKAQAKVAVDKVHPAAKQIAQGSTNPKLGKIINAGMSEIAVLGN